MTWPVFDAKARFSELLEASVQEGPQIVTKRGVETAVLVSISEWERMQAAAEQSLVDPLLDPAGPHDLYIPPRRSFPARAADLQE
jgi:antitoxin Phd